MQTYYSGSTGVKNTSEKADELMASGRWYEAETTLRNHCANQAELNLSLALLEWRRECVEYASMLDFDALGEDGVRQLLAANYDEFVADWVLTEYKG